MKTFVDMTGFPIHVGDLVAKAYMYGRSPKIEIRKVARIDNGKVWLNDSHVPLQHPERLIVVNENNAENYYWRKYSE